MTELLIEKEDNSPFIQLNAEKGVFKMEGRSIVEDPVVFYKPITEWFNGYMENPLSKTVLDVNLEYFNTSSSKCIYEIFRLLQQKSEEGTVTIKWYFEEGDFDMEETGENYNAMLQGVNFEFIEVPE